MKNIMSTGFQSLVLVEVYWSKYHADQMNLRTLYVVLFNSWALLNFLKKVTTSFGRPQKLKYSVSSKVSNNSELIKKFPEFLDCEHI